MTEITTDIGGIVQYRSSAIAIKGKTERLYTLPDDAVIKVEDGDYVTVGTVLATSALEAEVRAHLWDNLRDANESESVWESRKAMLEAGNDLWIAARTGKPEIVPVQQCGKTIWVTSDDPMGEEAIREVMREVNLALWQSGQITAIKKNGVVTGFITAAATA